MVMIVVRLCSTGTDVAREVVRLGPGVKRFSPGDKVLTYIHILVSTRSEDTMLVT